MKVNLIITLNDNAAAVAEIEYMKRHVSNLGADIQFKATQIGTSGVQQMLFTNIPYEAALMLQPSLSYIEIAMSENDVITANGSVITLHKLGVIVPYYYMEENGGKVYHQYTTYSSYMTASGLLHIPFVCSKVVDVQRSELDDMPLPDFAQEMSNGSASVNITGVDSTAAADIDA